MKSFTQYIGSNFLFESRLDAAIPRKVRSVITSGGGKIYQVGGAVRDEILGKVSKDLDLLVTGVDLSELEKRLAPYGKVNLVGKSFGILKFTPEGSDEEIDISVPRIDSKSTGRGHKEFEVKLGKGITLQQDQLRRDFWMNALSKDVETGEIHDVKGKGQLNIANKEVEMISPRAFQEDPLRMLRAVQFAARFDFKIEDKTLKEIQKNAKSIKTIAAERFQEEFRKMFEKASNVTIGIDYLFSTGIMRHLFPKAKRNSINTQIVNQLDKAAFPAFLAVLLGSDYGAENGAKIAMSKMRISKDDASAMSAVVKYKTRGFNMDDVSFVHMLHKDMSPSANVLKNLDAFAVAAGANRRFVPSDRLAIMKRKKIPYTLKQLNVSGRDMTSIGLRGRTVGEALHHLLYFAIRTGKNDKVSLMKEIKRKHRIAEEGYKNMKTFMSYMEEASVKWKKPKHSDEHDEIHTQSKVKPGSYPDHVHHMLNKLKDKETYSKAMRKGKKMTVTRNSVKRMSNMDAASGFAKDQDHEKQKRVGSQFKKGKVTKPVVLHDKDTGHTHLVAGNTRLVHNTHVNKKNTPVHAITYSSGKNKEAAKK